MCLRRPPNGSRSNVGDVLSVRVGRVFQLRVRNDGLL